MEHVEKLPSILTALEKAVSWDTSVHGDEAPLATWLANVLATMKPTELARGSTPRRQGADTHWVFARWGAGTRLINVHIDTVPATAGWTGDPLKIRTVGDDLVGLGASDNKGALAACVVALANSRRTDIAVLFSGDEERDSKSILHFLAQRPLGSARHAIVAEPTGCQPGVAHPGVIYLDLYARGPGGHSSLADVVVAPLLELARSAVALADADLSGSGIPLALNVAGVNGSVVHNVIPQNCVMSLSLRPPGGVDAHKVLSRVEETLGGRVQLTVQLLQPSFETADLETFRPILGGEAKPIQLPFWTEAALLGAKGVNTIVLGPGRIEDAHKTDEPVARSQLLLAYGVYSRFMSAG